MRNRNLSGVVLAASLLAGCSSGSVEVQPSQPMPPSSIEGLPSSGIPELPPAVRKAAEGILSIEVADVVIQTRQSDGAVLETRRQGDISYGSAVYIGNGDVLTANHVGAGGKVQGKYGCFGQELTGPTEASSFRADVDTAASLSAVLGDRALIHSTDLERAGLTPLTVASPVAADTQQKVFFVNYQSPDNNESHTPNEFVRSPTLPKQSPYRDPAIFSGVAKYSADGYWAILTGEDITTNYGSGAPTRLTGGGSGGALLNEKGQLLGLTTGAVEGIKPTLAELEQDKGLEFSGQGLEGDTPYWLSYAHGVTNGQLPALKALGKEACAPDDNDQIIQE